jgi:hypothetical protein
MEFNKQRLEELISAVDKIVEANSGQESDLFDSNQSSYKSAEFWGLAEQDPEKSYNLYYANIQGFMKKVLPKDNEIAKPIRELVCILLTGKEKKYLTYGARGADSRMAKTNDMENIIDVFSEWATNPTDFFRLGIILLNKNKELNFIPEERSIQDYI